MSGDERETLDLATRLRYLRGLTTMRTVPSLDSSVNHDSLVFLARFAHGIEANSLPVMGAIKTLGASSSQLGAILELLCEEATVGGDAIYFPSVVTERLQIEISHRQRFPAVSSLTADEISASQAESEKRWAERTAQDRQQRLKVEELDRQAAALLEVSIKKSEFESGWERQDNGARYSPTSDGAIACDLIKVARLNITHRPIDPVRRTSEVLVTFAMDNGQPSPMVFYSSDFEGSLAMTVCAAAIERQKVFGAA